MTSLESVQKISGVGDSAERMADMALGLVQVVGARKVAAAADRSLVPEAAVLVDRSQVLEEPLGVAEGQGNCQGSFSGHGIDLSTDTVITFLVSCL